MPFTSIKNFGLVLVLAGTLTMGASSGAAQSNPTLACLSQAGQPELDLEVELPTGKGFADISAKAHEVCEEALAGLSPSDHLLGAVLLASARALHKTEQYEEAAVRYQQAIEVGVEKAAANLASLYESGLGVEKDVDRAVELAQLACDAGAWNACLTVGRHHLIGTHLPTNDFLARSFLERACGLQPDMACRWIADRYEEGLPQANWPKDPSLRDHFLQRACREGTTADACSVVGYVHYQRLVPDPDYRSPELSVEFLGMGCERGSWQSCYNLGQIYRNDLHGIRQDLEKAAQYLGIACDGGARPQACYSFAVMLRTGQGIQMDINKAAEIYNEICYADDGVYGKGHACQHLAEMHFKGLGVRKSEARGSLLLQMACRSPEKVGCEEAEKLAAAARQRAKSGASGSSSKLDAALSRVPLGPLWKAYLGPNGHLTAAEQADLTTYKGQTMAGVTRVTIASQCASTPAFRGEADRQMITGLMGVNPSGTAGLYGGVLELFSDEAVRIGNRNTSQAAIAASVRALRGSIGCGPDMQRLYRALAGRP